MKIKLSRETVLGHERIGKVGEIVDVTDKLGNELLRNQRGEQVEEKAEPEPQPEPAKKQAKSK